MYLACITCSRGWRLGIQLLFLGWACCEESRDVTLCCQSETGGSSTCLSAASMARIAENFGARLTHLTLANNKFTALPQILASVAVCIYNLPQSKELLLFSYSPKEPSWEKYLFLLCAHYKEILYINHAEVQSIVPTVYLLALGGVMLDKCLFAPYGLLEAAFNDTFKVFKQLFVLAIS